MSVTMPDAARPGAIRHARRRLAALTVVLTCLGIGLLAVLALNAQDLGGRLDDLGIWTAPALIGLGAVLVAAMVPSGLLAGAAGFALGTVAGTPVALAAMTAGAVLCAVLGRRVGTRSARHAFGDRVDRTVTWLEARPTRSVIAARLLPGMPFNATSYVLGFTAIGLAQLAVGTAIGFAPRCFAYVALGGSLRHLDSPEARISLGASVALALLVIVGPRLVLSRADPSRSEETSRRG